MTVGEGRSCGVVGDGAGDLLVPLPYLDYNAAGSRAEPASCAHRMIL